jgi:hypothetical protein
VPCSDISLWLPERDDHVTGVEGSGYKARHRPRAGTIRNGQVCGKYVPTPWSIVFMYLKLWQIHLTVIPPDACRNLSWLLGFFIKSWQYHMYGTFVLLSNQANLSSLQHGCIHRQMSWHLPFTGWLQWGINSISYGMEAISETWVKIKFIYNFQSLILRCVLICMNLYEPHGVTLQLFIGRNWFMDFFSIYLFLREN